MAEWLVHQSLKVVVTVRNLPRDDFLRTRFRPPGPFFGSNKVTSKVICVYIIPNLCIKSLLLVVYTTLVEGYFV